VAYRTAQNTLNVIFRTVMQQLRRGPSTISELFVQCRSTSRFHACVAAEK